MSTTTAPSADLIAAAQRGIRPEPDHRTAHAYAFGILKTVVRFHLEGLQDDGDLRRGLATAEIARMDPAQWAELAEAAGVAP